MNQRSKAKPKKKKKKVFLFLILLCAGAVYFYYHSPLFSPNLNIPVLTSEGAALAEELGLQFGAALSPEQIDTQLAGDPAIANEFPLVDPAVTELQTEGEQQVLVGNGLHTIYYSQTDPRWADKPYGTDSIGGYACGPTAMAMVVSSLTDRIIDPPTMAQWAVDNGYWASQSGTYHSFIQGASKAFGLNCQSFTQRTPEALQNALLSGDLLVALMGPGHFTQGGHFIVLRGITLDGEILVADPNSVDRSLTAWDPQIIFDELSTSTAHGAPLWTISKNFPLSQ